MAYLLGVDTGGTYTDAVLIRDETVVVGAAKALTTRADLAIGVGNAVRSVLAQAGIEAAQVSLASLSTTLATNALVEGQGGRIGLIYIGFKERDLQTHGLADALKGDPCLLLDGGHNHDGSEAQPLDEPRLTTFLETHRSEVSGFAIASHFATRNPTHELRAAELVTQITGRPVSASHQLSAKVETILSGPAASIVGARWLTGADHALVSDIGGTTTDVALLRDGRPTIDPAGAQVGIYRTMVEAVAMRTTGLGGDSEVHFRTEGLQGGVTLGPKRLLPVSLVAVDDPEVVHQALDAQLRNATPGEFDGRFVRAVPGQTHEGIGPREIALLDRIGDSLHPLDKILRARIETGALKRLVERGLVQVAGVTPSDASHALGRLDAWDAMASVKALRLLGRRRTGAGEMLAPDPDKMAQIIIDQLTQQTALALLETAFAEETPAFDGSPDVLARHILLQRGLGHHRGLLKIDAALNLPVIGLGASAAAYYPAVGTAVGAKMILPEHAGVANAIGAVVGRVTMRESGTVTSPAEGKFRVHLVGGPQDFSDQNSALALLEQALRTKAHADAAAAGAADIQVTAQRDIRTAGVENREVFVEAIVTVEATGRPRVAVG